jgi:phage terminase Nu1 subunit (DNA packaging protein)
VINPRQASVSSEQNFPVDLSQPMTETAFAALVNRDQSTVSRWISDGILTRGADAQTWLRELVDHLAERAGGRRGNGVLDLVQERAALSRKQSERIDLELRRKREELMPIPLIMRVLSNNNSTVRAHLLRLPHTLRSRFVDLPIKVVSSIEEEIRLALTNLAAEQLSPQLQKQFKDWIADGTEPTVKTPSAHEPAAVRMVSRRKRKKTSKATGRAGKETRRPEVPTVAEHFQSASPTI